MENKELMKMFKDCTFPKSINLEKCFEDILTYIKQCEEQKDNALKKLEEWNKDEEILKLKEEIKKIRNENKYGFAITEEEHKVISEWMENHIKEKHNGNNYAGAIGGNFTYKFVPTSIGTIGEIHCSCGEKFCFAELC